MKILKVELTNLNNQIKAARDAFNVASIGHQSNENVSAKLDLFIIRSLTMLDRIKGILEILEVEHDKQNSNR